MTEEEIISGCITQDPRAQRMLLKKYKSYLYSACLKYVRNKYEADDIMQEAMISIFKYLPQFKGDCSLKGWLYQIVKNKAINHYNTEKRESTQHIAIEDYITVEKGRFSFEDQFLADDQLKKAMRVLQLDSPTQYMIFRLYHVEGLDYKEIKEDIGMCEGSAKSNVSRAVAKLREIITELNSIDKFYKATG